MTSSMLRPRSLSKLLACGGLPLGSCPGAEIEIRTTTATRENSLVKVLKRFMMIYLAGEFLFASGPGDKPENKCRQVSGSQNIQKLSVKGKGKWMHHQRCRLLVRVLRFRRYS